MDNDTFVAEESPREPPVYNGNQQGNNFTQTQSSLQSVIRMAKKGPMIPNTSVYFILFSSIIDHIFSDFIREYSCCSRHSTEIGVGAYLLFILLAITIGILVICLTVRKAAGRLFFLLISQLFRQLMRIDFENTLQCYVKVLQFEIFLHLLYSEGFDLIKPKEKLHSHHYLF